MIDNLILYYKLIGKEDTFMKKILFLFIIITLMLAASGCSTNEKSPLLNMQKLEEESLSYKIEKIILSKGFQSIEPNVEIISQNNSLKLLITTGLIESSGVTIDKITKSGNEINIYIDRLLEKGKTQLAVPQIIIEINEPPVERIEELKYNIVSQNYEPIALKFNRNQVLNKLYSEFKISPNTIPTVSLSKKKDQLVWKISFSNIFDKENYNSPLINFNVIVDAQTGEVLNSKKEDISTYIDDGTLLDYIPHSCLLYKRQHNDRKDVYESLWCYDVETGDKKKLYTSKGKIQSALFSPNSESISLIEVDENKADLYIIKESDNSAFKVTSINYLHPKLMKWKDENTLYFIDNSGTKSSLLVYDMENNNTKVQYNLNIVVDDFDILNNKLLFTENQNESLNKTIYLKDEGAELEELDNGFKAKFFNDSYIIYLKNVEKEDKNTFHVYDIKNQQVMKDLDHDISNYFKLDEGNVILIEKNNGHNDFILNKYNITNGQISSIARINSDKIFYDSSNEKCYACLIPPIDKSENSAIYSIDLNKLRIIDKGDD